MPCASFYLPLALPPDEKLQKETASSAPASPLSSPWHGPCYMAPAPRVSEARAEKVNIT